MGIALVLGMRLRDGRAYVLGAIMLLSQFSISALNDWADRDADKAAGRRRPVALGQIRPAVAIVIAAALAVLSLSLTLPFGMLPTLVLGLAIAAGWSYDLWLKPTRLSFVPFAIAFPLLLVWVAVIARRPVGSLAAILLATAAFAVAIHLADSLPDIEADAGAGMQTLSVRLGPGRAIVWIANLLIVGALLTVTNLYPRPLLSGAVAVIAILGALAAAVTGRRRPDLVRWIVAATAVADAVIVLNTASHA